ncbi:MAG: hypothetical protein KDE47_23220, partial [Caldilineaceae bacterium]|nr:hypothetical protein [Caldilineaceae bacterium]
MKQATLHKIHRRAQAINITRSRDIVRTPTPFFDLVVLTTLLLMTLLSACAPLQPVTREGQVTVMESAPAAESTTTDIAQRYAAALQDAKDAEPDEIVDTLTAITPDNPDLVWEEGRVLMVTWTSWNGYDGLVGQETALGREVWATAVPQVQGFCQSYAATAETPLQLRLEELLGLPADNGKTRFVEMWVTPADMFRPSPDGEIDDTSADLEMPGPDRFASEQAYEFHRDWFNLQMSLQAYDDPSKGYPWTRLGYTYDWGNPDGEVGLSEFVVAAGSTVTINDVFTNDA